jgi:DNA processing protein
VALTLTRQLGGKTFRALLAHFDHNLHDILNADEADLRQVPGIGRKTARAIRQTDLGKVEVCMRRWQQHHVQIVTWNDGAYPLALKATEDSPPTLFVRGTLPDMTRACAIVGTRRPAAESSALASKLAGDLAERGYTIVSGLALGIDKTAHQGALTIPGGQTVAVLGSGVLNVFPRENREFASAIIERGALISEVAPDSNVSTPGLVARNRIISGLSKLVVVVESSFDGGAMHAARFAALQGRPVYAADNAASGNQALLANGALPVDAIWEDFMV